MHFHSSHFQHLLNRELDELYASMAMRSFALSIVGIFVPLYLLEIGLSVQGVVIFFLVFAVTRAVFSIPSARLAAKYGLKKTMLASTVTMAVYYFLLRFAPGFDVNFLAVLSGIALTIFWTSYHIDFIKCSKKRYIGEEIGMVNVLVSLASFVGPFAGGAAILLFGFDIVFIAAISILALSTLPLFFSKDVHEPFSFSLKKIFSGKSASDYAGNLGFGLEFMTAVVWVIIIFLSITSNFASIGFVASISLVFSLLLSFTAGKYSNKRPYSVLRIGVVATALAWLIRLLVRDFLQLVVSDSIYGATRPAVGVPFDSMSYKRARKRIAEYVVFREMIIPLGGAIMFSIVLLTGLTAGIYAAIIGSLMMLGFRVRKK